MPGTASARSFSRAMVAGCRVVRASLRLISIRPTPSSVVLEPSTPMKELSERTSGSCRIAFATSCWTSAILV